MLTGGFICVATRGVQALNKIRNIVLGSFAMAETVQYVSNIYKCSIAYNMLQQSRGASYHLSLIHI